MLGQIEHPDAPERFGNTELKEEMPAADETLSKDDRAAMVEFLVQRTGLEYEPAVNVELAKKGEALLEESDCAGCHATTADAMSGPSLLDYGSKNFLRQVIRDPSHELLYGDLNKMPSFAHLSDEQIDELILYIQSLRTDGPPN
jgi:mono/diheme cytochrome c family protein